jgi:hypothetical protein
VVSTPNKKLNKDKKQLAFCSLRSLILANNFLPVNWALYAKEWFKAVGKLKLIEVELKVEHLWLFRIGMLLVSLPFVFNVYETITTNIALDGNYTFTKGDHWGYYAYLFKHMAISILFLWLGTFGSKIKRSE